MNNNSGDGTILNTLINKIQSVECRKYLESNIDSISLLQWCTIIIEASISKDERICVVVPSSAFFIEYSG